MEGNKAQRQQQEYYKKLDESIESLLDNFSSLIKAAKVQTDLETPKTFLQNEKEELQISVFSEQMISSTENLLKFVKDLKQTAILSDYAKINQNVEESNKQLAKERENQEKLIYDFQIEINSLLVDLENEYFSSKYH